MRYCFPELQASAPDCTPLNSRPLSLDCDPLSGRQPLPAIFGHRRRPLPCGPNLFLSSFCAVCTLVGTSRFSRAPHLYPYTNFQHLSCQIFNAFHARASGRAQVGCRPPSQRQRRGSVVYSSRFGYRWRALGLTGYFFLPDDETAASVFKDCDSRHRGPHCAS